MFRVICSKDMSEELVEVTTAVVVMLGSLTSLSVEMKRVCLVLLMLLMWDHGLRKVYRLFRILQPGVNLDCTMRTSLVDRVHKGFAGIPPAPLSPALIGVPRFLSR